MIRVTDWVADIPAEDKHIAYMGEHETCLRQFLLTGEDAARYAGWTFRLDVQFDVSTVTTATTRHTERVEEERERSMSETHDNEQTTTLKEIGTVTEVAVDCDNTTDIVYLSQERNEAGLLLTWKVLAQHTRLPGRLWATLRAQNADGAVKKSAIMLFTVDKAVQAVAASVPPLSQFEQMERAMDGRLVVLEEMTQDAVEAAQTAKANAADAVANKEQTAAYKQQAESAASTAEAAAEEAVEAAEGVHKSAYDVAVDNGFVGSEKEWLDSLQGATVEEIEAAAAVAADAAERANAAADAANGAAGGVVTIEQNSGMPMQFWVGTQAQYDALEEKKLYCFYLISDDRTLGDLEQNVSALQDTVLALGNAVSGLQNRDYVVESGSHDVGTGTIRYRKWNSGFYEMWGKWSDMAVSITNELAGTYKSDSRVIKLPFSFVGSSPACVLNVSGRLFPADAWCDGDNFYYGICSLYAVESTDVDCRVWITGYWK